MLYIDGSRMTDPDSAATGVEVYSNKLIPLLCKKLPNAKILTQPGQYISPDIPENMIEEIPGKRLWSQYHMPAYLQRKKEEFFLYSPSHVVPYVLADKGIGTIHDVGFKIAPEAYAKKARFYLDITTAYMLKRCKRVICISHTTKKTVQKYYTTKVPLDVVYNGYTPQNETPIDKEQKDQTIVFIGRIEIKKNIIRLIHAFEELCQTVPNAQLHLAGKPGHGYDDIVNIYSQSPCKENIHMHGFISQQQKHSLLSQAKAVYLGSLHEGFGFPILEAWDYNAIPICSDIPIHKEIA